MRTTINFNRLLFICILLFTVTAFTQQTYTDINLNDDYSWSQQDFGTMWTFDDIPLDYFQEEYGWQPDEAWLLDAQKSALRFGNGCSAAFVSEDGLIMTNHHCGKGAFSGVEKEGENILANGFIAHSLEEERTAEGYFVDQLISIVDVTDDILTAMDAGGNEQERQTIKRDIINELEDTYSNDTGLMCSVVELYNGAKFSMYCYKRYDNLKLVMAPELQVASTGLDWDNFTYPRYELDYMFFRAYENDKPVKVENYFTWSENGADENQPVFIVGNPGSTMRQLTVKNLLYYRDYREPVLYNKFQGAYDVYQELYKKYPERASDLLNSIMIVGNSKKVFEGRIWALNNPDVIERKISFEEEFKKKVQSDKELNELYGNLWNDIEKEVDILNSMTTELYSIYPFGTGDPDQLITARNLIRLAEQLALDNEQRSRRYKEENIEETKQNIFRDINSIEEDRMFMTALANFLKTSLGKEHDMYKVFFGGKEGKEAAEDLLNTTKLDDKEYVQSLIDGGAEAINNSDDPLLVAAAAHNKRFNVIIADFRNTTAVLNELNKKLGDALFAVYGETFPPDATGTLRISDGVVKGYAYNGTIAPPFTTYFGLYDRYYSFGEEQYPWGLPDRWQTIPDELDLTTPICFVSTNDIVGGNSGSSVINKNQEIVGITHDGNLESLWGAYIFLPKNNRAISTDSRGLMESLMHVYEADNLVEELKTNKLPQ